MEFKDILNEYIQMVDCSAKELAEQSGLSAATISRFRSGGRKPDGDGEQLKRLAEGIEKIANKKGLSDITNEGVMSAFEKVCSPFDLEKSRNNFNTLISVFSISISELSRALNYDSSYLSRIRSGQRRPSNPWEFSEEIARFIVRHYDTENDLAVAEKLIGCEKSDIDNESKYFKKLMDWLTNGEGERRDYMSDFLSKLNEFDLNEYIKALHFDEFKVPTVPFQLPTSRSYFGLSEMMNSELDFLKATVLSKSTEPVIMYSDMPMEEMAKNPEFPKKWMFGMAMMLKKGLHLNQIHNIDRSYEDMMLGLESWIPMYMTGQISPYYLTSSQSGVFSHFIKVSGTAALVGEAITGFHSDGKYYLTKNKDEVAYYKKRAEQLLSKAQPLMEIYRRDSENAYNAFMRSDMNVSGNRRAILSSLPLYTISDTLLNQILQDNHVSDDDAGQIYACVSQQREMAKNIMTHSIITEELPVITREDFAQHPMSLSLFGLFYETDILYSYENYLEHLVLTRQFEKEHPNYNIKTVDFHAFRNIQILIHEGKWVVVSKNKAPAIHFIIRHPKMRNAIENFIVPVAEE